MRTKTLLLAAAISVAGLVSSQAQPVYSQNIVGYINIPLVPGFNVIANQLDHGSNTLNEVFPSISDGALLEKFIPATGSFTVDVFNGVDQPGFPIGWYDAITTVPSTNTVSPGEGFFLNNPGGATNITLVGSVRMGTNSVPMGPGFSLIASVVPASYELVGTNFPTIDGMLYEVYSPSGFTVRVFNGNILNGPIGWYDDTASFQVTVQPGVGQGFFINNPGSATNWTRAFNP